MKSVRTWFLTAFYRKALCAAGRNGDAAKVRVLLERGVDVNAKDDRGFTALYFAVRGGHTPTVLALIEGGADVHMKGKYGGTVLDEAAGLGHVAIVRALTEAGANVRFGLHRAVRSRH